MGEEPQKTPENAPKEPSPEEKLAQLTQIIENQRFFSDQLKVNTIIWQGIRILLTEQAKIKELLIKLQELLPKKDGTA